MEYITYLLEVKVPRRYSVLVFFLLFFLAYAYLYLLGLGLFNTTFIAYWVSITHRKSMVPSFQQLAKQRR